MSDFSPLLILSNAIALALALSFVLLLLWYDAGQPIHQTLALFLIAVVIWNTGSLLVQLTAFTAVLTPISAVIVWLNQFGFIASSIASYVLVATLIGVKGRWFRILTLSSLVVMGGFVALILTTLIEATNRFSAISGLSFAFFGLAAITLSWQARRRIDNRFFIVGVAIFVGGQGIGLLNPELGITSMSTTIASLGALIASSSLLNARVIQPLRNAGSQLEALHEVSLAITSRIAIDAVLKEIAEQAVAWLRADGAGIYLFADSQTLELRTIHNLPESYIGIKTQLGNGPAGITASERRSILLENYPRDWHGDEDLPHARETFGSVICTPLLYAGEVTGVLMVVSSRHGRLLTRDDARLLELLCAQASVALEHSHLFNEQQLLAQRLVVAHDQLRTVLTSTENPVMALDRSLRFLFFNPAAERLLGSELRVGDHLLHYIPDTVLPRSIRQLVQAVRRGNEYVYEVSLRSHIYYCHIASLGLHRIQGWVVVLNDITQLKELDRMKSEMVRMTSHDLKNPLQAAMAHLDLLRDDLKDASGEIVTGIDKIEHQLNRMSRIISGILDLERVRSGVTLNERCSPDRLIANAVDELRENIQGRELRLSVSIPPDLPAIRGDCRELERALVNLIENAIKFTPPGGDIAVAASCEGDAVVISVSDTGIGIPEDQHELIYDRFFRGRQPGAEHISGSGLGLSLVKAIVDSHQGSIRLKSSPGKGTTFWVFLPSEKPQSGMVEMPAQDKVR